MTIGEFLKLELERLGVSELDAKKAIRKTEKTTWFQEQNVKMTDEIDGDVNEAFQRKILSEAKNALPPSLRRLFMDFI